MGLGNYIRRIVEADCREILNNTAPLIQNAQTNNTNSGMCTITAIANDFTLTVLLDGSTTPISGVSPGDLPLGVGSRGYLAAGVRFIQ